MEIILYTNNSEDHKLYKNLTLLISTDGQLKDTTDVINPSILLSYIDSYIDKVNYVYIPELNRYYFVTDIKSVRNGLWMLECHVDVLMSYNQDIISLNAIIERQEYDYNMQLRDTNIPTLQNTNIQYKKFPNTFTKYQVVLPILGN